jgi:hypothetical protein
MKSHDLGDRGKEPKLTQVKERVKPFEGNYNSVYSDYVEHNLKDNSPNYKGKCTVSPQQKEDFLTNSIQRIMTNPEMARQIFN